MKKIKIAGEANPPVNETARSVTKYLIQVSADGATYEDFDAVRGTNFTFTSEMGKRWSFAKFKLRPLVSYTLTVDLDMGENLMIATG